MIIIIITITILIITIINPFIIGFNRDIIHHQLSMMMMMMMMIYPPLSSTTIAGGQICALRQSMVWVALFMDYPVNDEKNTMAISRWMAYCTVYRS